MSVVVEELNLGNDAEVLSREELKKVLGGMGSGGSGGGSGSEVCHVKVQCLEKTTISCDGHHGDCHSHPDTWLSTGWVQCDNNTKVKCGS